MARDINAIRDDKGQLPAWAWPGGYPMIYLTKSGCTICPKCANKDDDVDPPVSYDTHMEGERMICDDCGEGVESAYGPVNQESK